MPKIFFYGPKLDKDKSRKMTDAFSETASSLTGINKSSFEIHLKESKSDDAVIDEASLQDGKKGGRGKVLIVGDKKGVADLLKNFLKVRGYEFEVAQKPKQVQELLKSGGYKLIFTDVVFYWSGGVDLIKSIREEDPNTPIIVITEYGPEVAMKAMNAGADDVLLKPFDILQMKKKIGRFVDLDMMEKRFGNTAVEKGFITPDQLIEALKIQIMEDLEDGTHRPLGKILLEQGLIAMSQVEEVLEAINAVRVTFDLIK